MDKGGHEPIVSKKDFNLVQELLKQDSKISPDREVLFPLAGLLYCEDYMEPIVIFQAGGRTQWGSKGILQMYLP